MHKQQLLMLLPKGIFCVCITFVQTWSRGSTQAFPLRQHSTFIPNPLQKNPGYAPEIFLHMTPVHKWYTDTPLLGGNICFYTAVKVFVLFVLLFVEYSVYGCVHVDSPFYWVAWGYIRLVCTVYA